MFNGADDHLVAVLLGFFASPVERLGWVLAGASIAAGLTLRWVRRAVSA